MSIKHYEYFDHTADTLFRAYGKDFAEALGNVVLATYNVIVETKLVQPVEAKQIIIEAKNKEALIYDLINELIYFLDTEGFLGSDVEDVKVEKTAKGWKATMTIYGDEAKGYDVFGQIKSATYNEMNIVEQKDSAMIQAVLDL